MNIQSLKDICYLCLPTKHRTTFWNTPKRRTTQDNLKANGTLLTSGKTLARLLDQPVKGKL